MRRATALTLLAGFALVAMGAAPGMDGATDTGARVAPRPAQAIHRDSGRPGETRYVIEELDPLEGLVEGDRVRYDVARARERDLLAACRRLADTDTAGWPAARRMALQIDLYDLAVIVAVVDHWKPGWTPAADGFAVFQERRVPTRTGAVSLDEMEKRRTLAVFRDPRAHVAFNCAARSCPRVSPWAHLKSAAAIDSALDARMREFLADTTRNRVDDAHRTLRLSRIFDWYAADFGGRAGVLATVGRYLGRDVSGYKVGFLDYDWSLNAAVYPDGSRPSPRPR